MPKVMIVDDDRTTVSLLQTLLEIDGFDVAIVPRGLMVVEKARQEHQDVFMCDYNLSDINGTEIVRRIRATPDFAKTPIVVVSGLNVEDEVRRAGANWFLVKPFEPNELAPLLKKLIGQGYPG